MRPKKSCFSKIFCHLIYYCKVYNIEMHRPVASVDAQKEYLKKKLDGIQDFYRYYRSDASYLDAAYFESVFNIDLGNNIARNFYDMRIRQQPTPFLDRLRKEIPKRMENTRPGKNNKESKE